MTPFNFVTDLLVEKKYIFSEETEQHYVPFIINKAISLHRHLLPLTEFMNTFAHLSKKQQHDFYFYAITPQGKRFIKWPKRQTQKSLNIISKVYNVSLPKAIEIEKLLTDDQRKFIDELEKQVPDG